MWSTFELQTYSDKRIRRIMYLCSDIATYPGTKLVSLVWEKRTCEHLKTTARMQKAAHARLRMVWSKLQLVKLLGPDADLRVVIDTEEPAVRAIEP